MPNPMLHEVAVFLEQFTPAITVGTPAAALARGVTLFVLEMPDKPDACVSLWPYGGGVPHLVDNIDEPTFQVRVKDVNPTSSDSTVQGIFNALHGIYERALITNGDWYWNRMFAINEPVYLGRDEVQRFEWCLNIRGFCRNPNRGGSGSVDH